MKMGKITLTNTTTFEVDVELSNFFEEKQERREYFLEKEFNEKYLDKRVWFIYFQSPNNNPRFITKTYEPMEKEEVFDYIKNSFEVDNTVIDDDFYEKYEELYEKDIDAYDQKLEEYYYSMFFLRKERI